MRVEKIVERDDRFYALVGPYMASRSVAKEIGYHIYEDDNSEWFIATERGKLLGFACCRVGKSVCVSACYTVQSHRKRGVMAAVLAEVLKTYPQTINASCNANSAGLFRQMGFRKVRANGSFQVMERKGNA